MFLKANRKLSVLKGELKRTHSGSRASSHRSKLGTGLEGNIRGAKDSKEAAKKVSKDLFSLEILINVIPQPIKSYSVPTKMFTEQSKES